MDVLIQDVDSGAFLGGYGHWKQDKGEALHFANSLAALEYCREHDLRTVWIRLCFGDPRFDVLLAGPSPSSRFSCPTEEPSPIRASAPETPRLRCVQELVWADRMAKSLATSRG